MTRTTTAGRAPRWLPATLTTAIAGPLALALFVGSTGHADTEESPPTDAVASDKALSDAVTEAEATPARSALASEPHQRARRSVYWGSCSPLLATPSSS